MEPVTKEDIGQMTGDSLELFLQIWEAEEHAAFVSREENGPRVTALAAKGFIRPAGKVGKKQRWQVDHERFNLETIKFAREVVKL